MQKLLFFALILGLFTAACKKTEPPPSGFNDPVFMVTYQTDTLINDTITAGLDGVYLFTRYEVTDSVFFSVNTFSDANCPAGDCAGSLSFEFREKVSNDAAFSAGTYTYSLPDSFPLNDTTYTVAFYWGDIFETYTEHNFTYWAPPYVYTVITPNASGTTFQQLKDTLQVISLLSTGANGLEGSILRYMFPSDLKAYPAVSLKATPEGTNNYILTAFSDWNASSTIQQYLWNTGQTTNSIVVDSVASFQEYSVTVTDDNGHTASASLSSLPFPAQTEIRNAQLSLSVTADLNPLQAGTVAIQWVDANGVIWRTDRHEQFSDFKFEVLESSSYELNENGDRTRKLKVRFNCMLYNEAGWSQPFSGEGTIAMAHP